MIELRLERGIVGVVAAGLTWRRRIGEEVANVVAVDGERVPLDERVARVYKGGGGVIVEEQSVAPHHHQIHCSGPSDWFGDCTA